MGILTNSQGKVLGNGSGGAYTAPTGSSLPSGGTKGQTLVKQSATDGDAAWAALYKWGVVSQELTYASSGANAWQWVVTPNSQEYGYIPQFFIDLVTSNAAEGVAGKVAFNATTGFFELNGITDIAYDEMLTIYNLLNLGNEMLVGKTAANYTDSHVLFAGLKARTNMASIIADTQVGGLYCNKAGYGSNLTVARLCNGDLCYILGGNSLFTLALGLREVYPVLDISMLTQTGDYGNSTSNLFSSTKKLEYVKLKKLKTSLTLSQATPFRADCVAYMIENVGTTSAITITLHATAYARAIADADVQAALASKTNVTLASA